MIIDMTFFSYGAGLVMAGFIFGMVGNFIFATIYHGSPRRQW